jgi:exopolyphosphatase/guanosine-5'-triphosphate,3'-diphosphate pyrophosphatase
VQQRIGIIDLGSNTTRLIVMSYTPHHSFKLVDEVRETVRLAEGADIDGSLQPAPMDRGVAAMKLFHNFCASTDVDTVVPTATSAVREATNRAEFLARVEQEAGLQLRVLSGEEEAYYGYLGVVNSLAVNNAFVIDIGGGSTEVSMIRGRGLVRSVSQPIGALRLAERYVRSDPISKKDFKALEQAVAERFADMDWLQEGHGSTLAGVGGTIRALGKIDQKARNYSFDRIHAYTFTRERLDDMVEMLRGMTLAERERVPGLNADRADLVLPGALIVRQVMRQGGFEELTVSGQGVREGLFYEHFLVGETPPLLLDMRGFSVQNLARVYNYETIHAAKVRELALALFDQTASLHGYGPWERELLGYAATIHDIGVAVGYYDHHKHGEYLVLNASLQGFSHREIVLLALLVRYHRKGNVSVKAYSDILNASDEQRVARLASLLRIAEYLERRKSQVVQGLHVEIGDTVRVVTQADDDASVEIWDANRRSDLFAQAFGRAIEIV